MKPMMNDEGLLECPFCGSENSMQNKDGKWHFVVCHVCGSRTDDWMNAATAVKKWNTRNGHLYTADDYKQDALERANGL
ncbi:Lar-like restriction alleviation protein [Klebsiella phage VLCpiS13c]|uniref:Lar-like restriction alleviation protein n=1 Tax=Klebsiella phage VLCpiS13c TaxID=2874887 RepID=UPI00233E83EC|nr:Lar-like restriction alleviation protein [Klebsiella phage VLCpiS13c]UVX30137.1 Lar-like restriction alleviation protein [Klebsiella phage VLCpiS13c]